MIKMNSTLKSICAALVFLSVAALNLVQAEQINIQATPLTSNADLLLSPRQGSFAEGSTFEVPIYVNTRGGSINSVDVRIKFDQSRLSIIRPSGGKSIIGIWVEPPAYDNARGTIKYVGVIPEGITTNSGLIGTITFKALRPGRAEVYIASDSKVLVHDGFGTEAEVSFGRAAYDILPKAPDGVVVYSETHPNQADWYNNKNPLLAWEKPVGAEGFSYVVDDKPSTIPDNTIDTADTNTSLDISSDGLWYFHIKASNRGAWGGTSHFLMRIDTTPPAEFTPEANYVLASVALIERTLVSFFTTDNLSGVDHYEVGVIDKNQPPTESPVFVEADSPFQVPVSDNSDLKVIVRAIDKAGNVRDASINVKTPFLIAKFVKDYAVYILLAIILIGFVMLLIHYLVGHHILRYIRKSRKEFLTEEQKIIEKEIEQKRAEIIRPWTPPPPSNPKDPWGV